MIKKIEILKNILKIICDKENNSFKFENDIQQSIIKNNYIFVLIKSRDVNRNVYCLNESGNIIWQIEDPDLKRPNKITTDSPFTWIQFVDDFKLQAFNWDSHKYEVDINTGLLKNPVWTK